MRKFLNEQWSIDAGHMITNDNGDRVAYADLMNDSDRALMLAAPILLAALHKIQFRCECFLNDGRSMNISSIAAAKQVCDEAIAKALASNS